MGIILFTLLAALVIIWSVKHFFFKKKPKKEDGGKKTDDKKKTEEKKEHDHHGPSFLTKMVCTAIIIIGSFYLCSVFWPQAWEGFKEWGYNLTHRDTSKFPSHPRDFHKQITVNDKEFTPIERYPDEAFWFNISHHGTIVRVTDMDGGNPQTYVHDGTPHKFPGARLYSFKAASGATAVITYTVSPRK